MIPHDHLEIITWKASRLTFKTVGWVTAENDKAIVITQHLWVEKDGTDKAYEVQFGIKKEAIISRQKL